MEIKYKGFIATGAYCAITKGYYAEILDIPDDEFIVCLANSPKELINSVQQAIDQLLHLKQLLAT